MYHFLSGYTAKIPGTEMGVIRTFGHIFNLFWGSIYGTSSHLRYAILLEQK
jgi:ATP-dependent phosphoenolpyruvate carboxykinase